MTKEIKINPARPNKNKYDDLHSQMSNLAIGEEMRVTGEDVLRIILAGEFHPNAYDFKFHVFGNVVFIERFR